MKKTKILITGIHLGIGGIETILVNILNNINYDIYDVDLILYKKNGINLAKIPQEVNVYSPFSYKKLQFLDKLTKKDRLFNKVLRKIFFNGITYKFYISKKNYDVGISFGGYQLLTDLLVAKSNCKKKYIWVHTDIKYCIENDINFKTNFNKNKFKYKYFDKIITVSKESMNGLKTIIPDEAEKIEYIWNPINKMDKVENEKYVFHDKYSILSIGRLEKAKGHDRLIEIAKVLKENGLNFKIFILGDGSLKKQISKSIEENNLKDYIILMGEQKNVYKFLKSANLLLVTSYYEGFSGVVMEGLETGIKIVAPKINGMTEIANEIAPKGSFILTENSIEGLVNGIKQAVNERERITNILDVDNYNRKVYKNINKVFKGEL